MKISFEVSGDSKPKSTKQKSSSKQNKDSKPRISWRKKLIILAIYLLLLIGLIFYVANPAQTYLADKPYVDIKAGFSIRPPKDWKTENGQNGSIVDFVNSKANNLDKITVSRDSTKLSLEKYVAAFDNLLPKELPYYTQYTEYNTKINDQTVHIIDGQALIKNDWKKTRLMIEVKNKNAYIVAAGITFGDWDGNKQIVGASLSSFMIL